MTYENVSMKVEIYTTLNPELRINTQFKNISTNYTKSDILTSRLVLLSADSDKNVLLFTKWLHMMNKIIDYTGQQRIKRLNSSYLNWFYKLYCTDFWSPKKLFWSSENHQF